MNQHALSHAQPALSKERVVSRDECFRYASRFGPIEIFRDWRESAFRHDYVLGLRAAASDAEDALACAYSSCFRPRAFDFASELKAGNILWRTRGRGIVAAPL
jgi:hypothetical protein